MTDKKPTLLLVDDTPANIDILVGILRENYQLKVALNGDTALRIINDTPPDLVLLDVMMPGMSGFEVCKIIKENPLTNAIPVIFVTALGETSDETEGLSLGAADYITKPVNAAVVKARVACHLKLYNQAQHLESLVQTRTSELQSTRLHIVQCLGRAAEYKDNETGFHVIRMSHYSELLARAVGLNDHFCTLLLHAAPMHDIGKIGVPDDILGKCDSLDDEEWRVMQQHPQLGSNILGDLDSELMQMASRIALTHHERWDGDGYPHGISGEQIPLEGRIVAISDVFDALTSARPYKPAWSLEETMAHMKAGKGTHFDPDLIDVFVTLEDQLLQIRDRYLDNDDILG